VVETVPAGEHDPAPGLLSDHAFAVILLFVDPAVAMEGFGQLGSVHQCRVGASWTRLTARNQRTFAGHRVSTGTPGNCPKGMSRPQRLPLRLWRSSLRPHRPVSEPRESTSGSVDEPEIDLLMLGPPSRPNCRLDFRQLFEQAPVGTPLHAFWVVRPCHRVAA